MRGELAEGLWMLEFYPPKIDAAGKEAQAIGKSRARSTRGIVADKSDADMDGVFIASACGGKRLRATSIRQWLRDIIPALKPIAYDRVFYIPSAIF